MTVVRWNPMRDLAAMQNAMDRLFYDTLRANARNVQDDAQALAVDIYETDAGYLVTANVPGVNPDSIQVRVEDHVLTIALDVPQSNLPTENARAIIIERPTGHFSRRLQLPAHVDASAAEAGYEQGVLTLMLPRRVEAQPKVVPVRLANGRQTEETVRQN